MSKRLLRGEAFEPPGRLSGKVKGIFLHTSNSAECGKFPRDIFFINPDGKKTMSRLWEDDYRRLNPYDDPDNYENKDIDYLEKEMKRLDGECNDLECEIEELEREREETKSDYRAIEKILEEKKSVCRV